MGRGGILFVTAHGILAEVINCSSAFSRCIVFFGVPIQCHLSFLENTRMEYTQKVKRISKSELISFETMRVIGSLVGRMLGSRLDYMAVVMADTKFTQYERIKMLPEWLRNVLQVGGRIGITEDSALQYIKSMLQNDNVMELIRNSVKSMSID